jgi:predicted CopG family antitoxin
MATKNIGIREDVYEHLKSHKRGDESFSDTLNRLLSEADSDWRTHFGFLSEEDAAEFERVVEDGLSELDDSLSEREGEIITALDTDETE